MAGVACPQCGRTMPDGLAICQICGARLLPPVPCPSCGHQISANLDRCPYCYGTTAREPVASPVLPQAVASSPPSPAPTPKKPAAPDPARLRIDIRARVLWGEDRRVLRADLLNQGFAPREIDAAVADAYKERDEHFRRLGRRDLLIGAGCCVGFLLALGAFLLLRQSGRVGLKSARTLGFVYLSMVGLPAAAVFFFIRGARRIAKGGQGEGGATDVEEGD